MNNLKSDIAESELCKHTHCTLTELALLYDVTFSDVLEKHAPLGTKQIVVRPQVPWFTDSVRRKKGKRERLKNVG